MNPYREPDGAPPEPHTRRAWTWSWGVDRDGDSTWMDFVSICVYGGTVWSGIDTGHWMLVAMFGPCTLHSAFKFFVLSGGGPRRVWR